MSAFFETTLLLLSLSVLFFLPGYFLLRLFLRSQAKLSPLETITFSFAIGLGALNFLMILLGKSGILLTKYSLSIGILTLVLVAVTTTRLIRTWYHREKPQASVTWPFSRRQSWIFVTLLLLTFLIKTIFLSDAVLPTATDLGHHMYWSKLIAQTGTLPLYAKQDIVTDADGTYRIADPAPIADFIIGEHLPFAALHLFSGLDFLSAFPVNFLFLINLCSLLALVLFARTLAESIRSPFLSESLFTPQNIALATLFLFGPLYTLASPQEKFVSGGVVGNTLGNFFLPLILFAYLRAFRDKRSDFLAIGFFLTFTLAYIHHLSTLMTLFVLGASIITYLAFHFDTLGTTFRHWWTLLRQPKPLALAILACLFFFLVAMPTYIETHAVGTALGTPTKTTRTGLSWYQITFSSGEARVALGLAGLFLITFLRTRVRYASAFLIGWCLILLIMTLRPELLFINIPSNRIGAYLSFPLGLLAAFAFVAGMAYLNKGKRVFFVPGIFAFLVSLVGFVYASGSGSFDNSATLLGGSKALPVIQTFTASRYLAAHVTTSDVVLKDHNYIVGDAWMKLFFLRDYSYPLSRGFFKRYQDNPDREQCTLLMIAVPNTARGEKCYTETGTNLIVVNPAFDTTPFEKSSSFSRLYASDSIHIYVRKK
ncbi:MAG: hypothetical protein KBA91_02920 [Candidatus Moranbacteria bacterium]|jgi:hypothetical protein|nr:hypothetical protein [Candidatus Moranbacteria bacterium]